MSQRERVRFEDLDPSTVQQLVELFGRFAGLSVADLTMIFSVPRTITDAAYTLLDSDSSIICDRAGTVTLTLPDATAFPGRMIIVKTVQAQAVVSASSNVVPLLGGAAGTAILAAVDGRWALMLSDGASWVIMAAN